MADRHWIPLANTWNTYTGRFSLEDTRECNKKVSHCFSAFAILRSATNRFVMLVCAWDNSASNGRIFIKFGIWGIFENPSRKFKFDGNLTKITGILHEDLCTSMTISCRILPKMKNISDRAAEKNQNTHFLLNVFLTNTVLLCKYRVIQNVCRGVNNLSYTIHLVLQMQPHMISFYGVMSRIRFMFLLFPQVFRNWRLLHAINSLERTPLSCWCL